VVPLRPVAIANGGRRARPQRLVSLEDVLDRVMQSPRIQRQLEHARSLEAEIDELRRRLGMVERHLGIN
jgi:hypothetical protein